MAKSDFLSPLWQKKRLEILERDGWKCYACGATGETLHVHHVMYCGKPWEAPSGLLQTLCDKCHKALGPHRRAGVAYLWMPDGPADMKMTCLSTLWLHCPNCGFAELDKIENNALRCPECGFHQEKSFGDTGVESHYGCGVITTDEFMLTYSDKSNG